MTNPRLYVNDAAVNGGKHDVALNLSYKLDDDEPVVVAEVAMSRDFLPILIELLKKQLR